MNSEQDLTQEDERSSAPADAEKRGVGFCMSCHSATDCVRCHMK